MEGVADLVGEGEHVAEGVVVGHVDAGLAGQQRSGAEGAGPLAGAGRVIDPSAIADLSEELPQARVGRREGAGDEVPAFFPGELPLVGQGQRRPQIVPGHALGAHELRLESEDPARQFDLLGDGREHGVEGPGRNGGLEEGDIEEVVDAAVPVEGQARPRDGVERGGGDVLHALPGPVASLEGGLAHPAVGVFHQGAALRHGAALGAAVGKGHVELELAGDRVVEAAPGVEAVDAEVGGEHLLLRAHGALRVFALAAKEVAAVAQGGSLGEPFEGFIRGVLEGAQEFDIQLFALGGQQGEGGLLAGVVLVAGVRGGEAAEVGSQVGEPVGQPLGQQEYGLPGAGIVLGERRQGGGLLTRRREIPFQLVLESPHGRAVEFVEIAGKVPVHGGCCGGHWWMSLLW